MIMKKPVTLIVEDNQSYRHEIRDLLTSQFPAMIVVEAADGNEALSKVEECQPSFIFMDIALPGENGLSLTRKIKSSHPNITIAILTNYDWVEYKEAAQESGADHYLVKGQTSLREITSLFQSQETQNPCTYYSEQTN